MVIGSYSVSVDSKGRIFVPSRWRDDYGDTLILMRGLSVNPDEHFITVMSVEEFERFAGDLNSVRYADSRYNDAARQVLQFAFDSQIDTKGRISVNSRLLEYAGISTQAVAVATRNKCFEIWEPDSLAAKNAAYTQIDSSRDMQKRADELEQAGK